MLTNDIDLQELELITQIARLYYLENQTQGTIADRLHISRSKTNRLLKRAREEGIVQIRVQTHATVITHMERELRNRYALKHVFICDEQLGQKVQRAAVAAQVADYLIQNVHDGMVISVGLGRNTSAVPDQITGLAHHEHDLIFVPAMGGSPQNEIINPDHTCRRLAERFGAQSESLYAPAYAESPSVRNSLMAHETVRRTLDIARRSAFALVGIGDVANDATVVRMGCFSADEMASLREAGAVGDIMGYFYDLNGKPVIGIQDRVIGVTIEELRHIPNVIAIASEDNKPQALLGALRTGVVDILATTANNVRDILTLDTETRSTS